MCAADEAKILCIIRDMVDTTCHGLKHTQNLPISTSVLDVVQDISNQFGYAPESIDIHYEQQNGPNISEVVHVYNIS